MLFGHIWSSAEAVIIMKIHVKLKKKKELPKSVLLMKRWVNEMRRVEPQLNP